MQVLRFKLIFTHFLIPSKPLSSPHLRDTTKGEPNKVNYHERFASMIIYYSARSLCYRIAST